MISFLYPGISPGLSGAPLAPLAGAIVLGVGLSGCSFLSTVQGGTVAGFGDGPEPQLSLDVGCSLWEPVELEARVLHVGVGGSGRGRWSPSSGYVGSGGVHLYAMGMPGEWRPFLRTPVLIPIPAERYTPRQLLTAEPWRGLSVGLEPGLLWCPGETDPGCAAISAVVDHHTGPPGDRAWVVGLRLGLGVSLGVPGTPP